MDCSWLEPSRGVFCVRKADFTFVELKFTSVEFTFVSVLQWRTIGPSRGSQTSVFKSLLHTFRTTQSPKNHFPFARTFLPPPFWRFPCRFALDSWTGSLDALTLSLDALFLGFLGIPFRRSDRSSWLSGKPGTGKVVYQNQRDSCLCTLGLWRCSLDLRIQLCTLDCKWALRIASGLRLDF